MYVGKANPRMVSLLVGIDLAKSAFPQIQLSLSINPRENHGRLSTDVLTDSPGYACALGIHINVKSSRLENQTPP